MYTFDNANISFHKAAENKRFHEKDVKHLKAGELDRETFDRKYQSRLGHMGHADTYHVTKAIEYDLLFWEFEQTQSGLLVPV